MVSFVRKRLSGPVKDSAASPAPCRSTLTTPEPTLIGSETFFSDEGLKTMSVIFDQSIGQLLGAAPSGFIIRVLICLPINQYKNVCKIIDFRNVRRENPKKKCFNVKYEMPKQSVRA